MGKFDFLKISGKFVAPQLGVIIPFNVFLYEENDKIVLTDIDGTITQSDIKVRIFKEFFKKFKQLFTNYDIIVYDKTKVNGCDNLNIC